MRNECDFMQKMRISRSALILSLCCLLGSIPFSACTDQPVTEAQPSASATALETGDLDSSVSSALLSTRNALNQARNAFLQISGRLQFVAPDLNAYQEASEKVQTALILAAHSLTASSLRDTSDSDVQTLKDDFRQLYSDVLNQMMNGIQLNLQIYQNQFESPQSLGDKLVSATSALQDLGVIFQATEYTKRYISALSVFDSLITQSQTNSALSTLQNQQTVLMNGILNFSAQVSDIQAVRQAYAQIVHNLNNPSILNQVIQLAVRAYGQDNVAYRQDQVTTVQPNPNRLILVVRESSDQYRQIQIDNDQLKNQLIQDSRGLRASDFLNQTNVVLLTPSPAPS